MIWFWQLKTKFLKWQIKRAERRISIAVVELRRIETTPVRLILTPQDPKLNANLKGA